MAIEQQLGAIGLGLLQLIVGLVLAMGSIYVGFRLFNKILKEIDLQDELKKGNTATGVVSAAIIITIAGIISSAVSSITSGISTGISTDKIIAAIVGGIIQLIIGIILAIVAIYIAFKIWGKITKEIDEGAELKKNNVAIGVVMAGVLIAVGFVVQGSISGIASAISTSNIVSVVLGLAQLVIGLILAMVCIYIGYGLFDKILKEIDLEKELVKGNLSIGIVSAAIMITISEVISTGVGGITSGITGNTINVVGAVIGGVVQLVVGIIFAVIAIYLAFKIWDKITAEIEETDELNKNNVAIGVVMAGVLISVGFVIQSAVSGIGLAIASALL